MFHATLLACFMALGPQGPAPQCIHLGDNRGPYETHEACKARLDEIAELVRRTAPGPLVQLRGKCEDKSEPGHDI